MQILTDDQLILFGSILKMNFQKCFKTILTFNQN